MDMCSGAGLENHIGKALNLVVNDQQPYAAPPREKRQNYQDAPGAKFSAPLFLQPA